MYYLDGKAVEASNEVNEATVFLRTKCLPGKLYAVHSWTNFRKKKAMYVVMWTMVQDTMLIAGAQPLALHRSACVLCFALMPVITSTSNIILLQQIMEVEATHCFVIGCHRVSEQKWLH